MKIAILADVHANLPALRAVLADAEQQGCERVCHHHGVHFLNPGSAGCSRDGLADYAVIDLAQGIFQVIPRRVPYDRQALLARYDELEIPARQFIRKTFFDVTPLRGSR